MQNNGERITRSLKRLQGSFMQGKLLYRSIRAFRAVLAAMPSVGEGKYVKASSSGWQGDKRENEICGGQHKKISD